VDPPSDANRHQESHAEILLASYRRLTGKNLIDPGPNAAKRLFESPFFVASHNTEDDPVLTYGNLTALTLFEMSWEEFTATPSRFTAEAPLREERQQLLERVTKHGYIDDYSGIRISKSGQRFHIRQATVWNLHDPSGKPVGQAASFDSWQALD
jgi:hypothetical protein